MVALIALGDCEKFALVLDMLSLGVYRKTVQAVGTICAKTVLRKFLFWNH